MNNIFKSALLLMAVAFMFTACSDDRDSNPVLQQPDSFVLNTPAYAGQAIDLANSQTVNLTWSQPDYGGFPVAAEYTVELSATNEWTIPYSAEVADESGETQCNYFTIENIFSSCNAEVSAADVAKAIVVMCNYADESEIPAQQELYAFRLLPSFNRSLREIRTPSSLTSRASKTRRRTLSGRSGSAERR